MTPLHRHRREPSAGWRVDMLDDVGRVSVERHGWRYEFTFDWVGIMPTARPFPRVPASAVRAVLRRLARYDGIARQLATTVPWVEYDR